MISIWLPEENGIDTIAEKSKGGIDIVTRNQMIVTDEDGYKKLIDELRDFKKYIKGRTYHILERRCYEPNFVLTPEGAKEYTEVPYGPSNNYEKDEWEVQTFINPRSLVYQVLTGDTTLESKIGGRIRRGELAVLFDSIFGCENNADLTARLASLNQIAASLEHSGLSGNEIKPMFKEMQQNFGFFATEALNYIDFVKICEYSRRELSQKANELEKEYENLDYRPRSREERIRRDERREKVESDLRVTQGLLWNSYSAEENQKVLTLARRINNLTRR